MVPTFFAGSRPFRLVPVCLVIAALVSAPVTSAGAPSAETDLAAVIVHPSDLDWIVEEMDLIGQLDNAPYITDLSSYVTTADEVVSAKNILHGRGGFDAGRAEGFDLRDLLEASGWVRTADAFMVRQASLEGMWITGIGASIEEYESEEGAALAFETLADTDILTSLTAASDIEALDAPNLGDDAVMWSIESNHWGSPPVPVISLWVLVDNLVVSIAVVDASEITEPEPEMVEQVMRDQLRVLRRANRQHQPDLAACAPRILGETTLTLSDDYALLDGESFGQWGDTYDDVAEFETHAGDYEMVDRHRLRQALEDTESGASEGRLFYTVYTRSFEDDRAAEAYFDDLDSVLAWEGRDQVEELDNVPDMGDGSRSFTYVGTSGSPSAVTYVLLDNLVLSVYLGASFDPMSEETFDLAEAYVERLGEGDCDAPLNAPRGL